MNNDYQNPTTDMELESMRHQMSTLKKKLNEQEIVNERLMRQSMKKEVSDIIRRYHALMAIGILMVPYGYLVFVVQCHFSIAFWIATSIFMLVCAGATFYNSRKISEPGLMSHSLVEVRQKMASAKKFDSDWLFFGIPAVLLWLGWFMYEVYQLNNGTFAEGLFWGGCVGGIIGAVLGFKIHFKTQHQYQDIINQIEDLTAE